MLLLAMQNGIFLYLVGDLILRTCFDDLHILDLENMEWTRPEPWGAIPGPRAGHAGAAVGENWFIVGGGDNKSGVSETLLLNMSTLVWSVVTNVEGRVSLASEGLSLVWCTYNGEDFLVSFGGYHGRYSNEVYDIKPSHKSDVQSNIIEMPQSDNTAPLLPATDGREDVEPGSEPAQDGGGVRVIVMDSADSENLNIGISETSEQLVASLKAEKEELEATLRREQVEALQLKQDLAEAETRNTEITKELQSVRGQIAAEQSRCFKLEVDVALGFRVWV